MLIGLTGLTGSGKTTVSGLFRSLGCIVCDCDSIAHKIIEEESTKSEIRSYFGDGVIKNGQVNRKALGKIVFSDEKKLKALNKIMHPKINEYILSLHEKNKDKIVIADGSELEESGIDEKCNYIIVIDCDEKIRKERIMSRDNITSHEALLRIRAQKPYSKKAIIIKNDTDTYDLTEEVKKVFYMLSEEADG